MRKAIWILVGLGVAGGLLSTAMLAQVDFDEVALVKRFGKVQRVVDGRTNPGLIWTWPWPIEREDYYKTSTYVLEDPLAELQLQDKVPVAISMYCQWRIEDPRKFNSTVRSVEEARGKIIPILQSKKADVVGRMTLGELVNTDPTRVKLDDLVKGVSLPFGEQILNDYGIRLVQLGVKSIAVPESVSKQAIEAQIAERQVDSATLEFEGRSQAQAIRDRAKAAREQILAFADRRAKLIEAEGDIAAARQYTKFREAPELSVFLRYIETLKALKDRTVFVLDDQIPAIRWFVDGPKTVPMPKPLTVSSQPAVTP
jgi:membrane protease subunit HflC